MSFIENLTAESLNMAEKDFNAYMSGECVPANTWESALMICEVMVVIYLYSKDFLWIIIYNF